MFCRLADIVLIPLTLGGALGSGAVKALVCVRGFFRQPCQVLMLALLRARDAIFDVEKELFACAVHLVPLQCVVLHLLQLRRLLSLPVPPA